MALTTYTYTDLLYGSHVVATFPGIYFDNDPVIKARIERFVHECPEIAFREDGVYACQHWRTYNPYVECEVVDDE